MIVTKDWDRFADSAKILIIGHDPKLRTSSTLADYCFFANYYFDKVHDPQYVKKRALAESVFNFIHDISDGYYNPQQVYITNLCNEALPAPPIDHTVYIPEASARRGLSRIRQVLSRTNIEFIFAMSEQVNYWLQVLAFRFSEWIHSGR